ncbi:MAG: endolytic transglycosylase MltG [Candidatus Levybacteria bacterium]|nr:endolytic transglycosylase MltG [Candidatus Levybacteria bacterium]
MKKLIILISILIASVISGVVWWENGKRPPDPTSEKSVIFVVKKGDGVREIANNLKEKGLIRSRIIFFLLIKQFGLDKDIQAGDFRLSPKMTTEEIALNLTHGTLDIWVTIPEGKRAEEIAEVLKKEIPTYNDSWQNILMINEGYLFPDTYLIPKNADIEMVLNQLRGNFEQKYSTLNILNAKLNQKEIVILASLIEREAITDEEKPIIAGILMNRLNAGMALQVDATIQYAKGKNASNNKWWEPVTTEEYKSVLSNYNTYINIGLPPGPISNPGLEALRAAANPSDTNYLYYLHDKNKTIRYARTLTEHNENIKIFGL